MIVILDFVNNFIRLTKKQTLSVIRLSAFHCLSISPYSSKVFKILFAKVSYRLNNIEQKHFSNLLMNLHINPFLSKGSENIFCSFNSTHLTEHQMPPSPASVPVQWFIWTLFSRKGKTQPWLASVDKQSQRYKIQFVWR